MKSFVEGIKTPLDEIDMIHNRRYSNFKTFNNRNLQLMPLFQIPKTKEDTQGVPTSPPTIKIDESNKELANLEFEAKNEDTSILHHRIYLDSIKELIAHYENKQENIDGFVFLHGVFNAPEGYNNPPAPLKGFAIAAFQEKIDDIGLNKVIKPLIEPGKDYIIAGCPYFAKTETRKDLSPEEFYKYTYEKVAPEGFFGLTKNSDQASEL